MTTRPFPPLCTRGTLTLAQRGWWMAGVVLLSMACTVDNQIVKIEGNDAWRQADPAEVDVLVVIDDSGSMEQYQAELATRFDTFLSYFDVGIDYRIGVTTSTMVPAEPFGDCDAEAIARAPQGGVLAGEDWIDSTDTDGAERFAEYIQVGICGGTYEMGMESAYLAVTGANPGFRRPNASLSIVFVSDEEDNSPGTTSEYLDGFRESVSAPGRDAFNASALVVVDEEGCSDDQLQAGAHPNLRFPELATQTGGTTADLCTDDFDEIVTRVSQTSSRQESTFYLSEFPAMTTLEVGVEEELVPCSDGMWSYAVVDDRPAIVFAEGALPPPGSRITASYDHGAGDVESFCQGSEE